jgi:hypothetical protein
MTDSIATLAMSLPCVYCGAQPGQKCRTKGGTVRGNKNHDRPHAKRRRAALRHYAKKTW